MIPKKIHYCWFGGTPKPKSVLKCIESWKKHCPDYEIIRWDENKFDISSAPLYVRQAYDAKKWAFVSDYVRLYAMYNHGGIYMDTDVEIIKPLDSFLNHESFSGFEDGINISTGIMACEKHFELFEEFLNYYDDIRFIGENGEINYTTNVTVITNICLKYGLVQNNTLQTVHGFTLYPKDYFCPIEYGTLEKKMTNNTVAIHHFAASWFSKDEYKKLIKNRKKYRRLRIIDHIIHIPNRVLRRVLGEKCYERLKKFIKG